MRDCPSKPIASPVSESANQQFSNSGTQQFRNSGIQQLRTSGIQETSNSGMNKLRNSATRQFIEKYELLSTSKTPKITSKTTQTFFSGCFKHSEEAISCQVLVKSLPSSKEGHRRLSAMAKHNGLLPRPWPSTKGGLAVSARVGRLR